MLLLGQQPSCSPAHSQDGPSSDTREAAAPLFMDTLPHSLENLTDKQTRLESKMVKLTVKVDAMDAKMDQILSLLLSSHGHDAKKGEKQKATTDDPDNTDDVEPKSSRGHRQHEATTDVVITFPQKSTHVAGTSQVTHDSGTSRRRLISDTAVVEQVSHG